MTTQPDLEPKRLELAEKWWVPCYVCHGNPNPEPDPGMEGPCSICHGTGKDYPLRKPCPDENCIAGILLEDDLPFGRKGNKHKDCSGHGWIPNVTLETMLEALWGAAWEVRYWKPKLIMIKNTKNARFIPGDGETGELALLDAMLQIVLLAHLQEGLRDYHSGRVKSWEQVKKERGWT